ncbi:F-box domain containing protein [Aphelenchoides avenae]|nr:F-box domain containing protein [Aphelenchus avenae]
MAACSSSAICIGSPNSVQELPVQNPANDDGELGLLSMPTIVLRRIFGFMTYEHMSHSRAVSKTFKTHMERELNNGFHLLGRVVANSAQRLKKQLPKRESERRSHPFHRYAEIFSAIETRYTLLTMTYKKYIDQNFCCFIPGKVLDLAFVIVNRINGYLDANQHVNVDVLGVLVEIRDFSSMAMEHFDEHIAPKFPAKPSYTTFGLARPTRPRMSFGALIPSPVTGTPTGSDEFDVENKLKTMDNRYRMRFEQLNRTISEQNRLITEQRQFIDKIIDVVGEMGKTMTSSSAKLLDGLSELSATRTLARANSKTTEVSNGSSKPRADLPSTSKQLTAVCSCAPKNAKNLLKVQLSADVPSTSSAAVAVPEKKGKYNLRKRKASASTEPGQKEEPAAEKRMCSNR